MAAYYKVDVVLNSQAVQVGLPSPQSVSVTLPLVGPAGPVGPKGDKGDPGEVSGSIAWDNVTEKPTTFPPSTHTHVAADITDFTAAVEAVSPPADWDTLSNKPSTFTPSLHGSTHHTGGTDAIAAHQINGQTIFSAGNATYSSDQTLSASRALQLEVGNTNAGGINLTLPTAAEGTLNGDTIVIIGGGTMAGPITVRRVNLLSPLIYGTLATITAAGQQFRFRATSAATGGWSLVPVDTHTHPSSAISDFTTAAAAAAPVQSVNGNTGTVTVAVPSASTATPSALGTAAAGTASEFARGDHVHAMPSASDVGAASDTDARLTDTRDPNAHAASHFSAGADPIAPSDIGAQSKFVAASELLTSSTTTLTAGRARRIELATTNSGDTEVVLPTSGNQQDDLIQLIRGGSIAAGRIFVVNSAGGSELASLGTTANAGRSFTFRYQTGANAWILVPVDAHGADKVISGTLDIARLPVGTGSTQVAAGNHTHVVADVTGAAASGSITTSGLTQATARILGRTTASTGAVEEISVGSGLSLSAGELTATGGGGGATNLWIPASAWIPRTTAGCGVDSREIGSTNRQNFDELLFDAGTDEFAQALVIMPSNYNNSTITARFYWTAASGSGDVIWGLQGRAYADDDALDTAHGTAQTATDTLLAADDMHVSAATSAVTIGGTPAANTPIQFQVYRDADAGGDTLAVDARLLGVEIIFN